MGPSNDGRPLIERASPADLAFLEMDTGKVPRQFAVVLILERPADLGLVGLRLLIGDRILAVPRLRQRLIKVSPGCGRPVWVDDPDFAVDRHVRAVSCRSPGDEAALFDTALSVIMTPLPRDHPLWSIVLITELADCAAATGPPPIAVLGGLFRFFARLGGYRFYMNHQHRFHTLVTHVRGPVEPVRLDGHEVSAAIPVAVSEGGNTTVYFEALSYAGVLTITAIVDPDHGPDPDDVIRRLWKELDLIMARPRQMK